MEELGLDVPQKQNNGGLSNKGIAILVTCVVSVLVLFSVLIAVLIPSGEESSATGKVEVISSQMTYDYSEYLGYDIEVHGTIKNNTSKDYSYVSVSFSVYDSSGNNLGTVMDSINNLSAGETWSFTAELLYTDSMPVSYKLKEINKW